MRSQGGFSVAWEKYSSVMCAGFQELQQRAEFVDMTIAADGYLVRVHQMVVGLASPFLKELLRSAPSPNPVLFLNNVSHKMLCCILEYMYTGEALVPADDLKTFIATAKALRVRGLEDMMVPEPVADVSSEEHEVVEMASTLAHEASSNATIAERSASIKLHAQKQDTIIKVDQHRSHNSMEPITSHHTLCIPSKKRLAAQTIQHSDMTDYSPIPAKILKKAVTADVTSNDEGADHWTCDADEDHNQEDQIEHEDTYKVDSTLDEQGSLHKKVKLMFTVSNQGARQLILNRYIYRLRHIYKDGRIRWECIENKRKKCNATVITMDNVLVTRYSAHIHAFHDKKIMTKVKKNSVFAATEKVNLCADRKSTD